MAKAPIKNEEPGLEDDEAVDVSPLVQFQLDAAKKAKADAEDDSDDDDSDDDLEDDSDDDDSDDDLEDDSDDDLEDDSDDDDSDDDLEDDSDDADSSSKASNFPTVPRRKKTKKQSSMDERIKELTDARKKAEKEAFDAQMALIAQQNTAPSTPTAPAEAPKEPKAGDFVYGEVDPDYVEALVDYKTALKVAEATAAHQTQVDTSQEAARNAEYAAKVQVAMAAGAKKYKDFEETVGSATFDPQLARLIVDSPEGIDIAYYLANNIGELLTATKATSEERARIVGKLEGRFSVTSTERKKRSKAPKPLKATRRKKKEEAQYGPSDQDAFDKEFYGV